MRQLLPDCKSGASGFVGSNPTRPTNSLTLRIKQVNESKLQTAKEILESGRITIKELAIRLETSESYAERILYILRDRGGVESRAIGTITLPDGTRKASNQHEYWIKGGVDKKEALPIDQWIFTVYQGAFNVPSGRLGIDPKFQKISAKG